MEQPGGALDRYAVLTATPDLIAAGLVRALVERLKRRAIVPVAMIPHLFSDAESFMLYGGRVTHQTGESRQHSKWLSPRMFEGGASLILLLRQAAGGAPLQQRLMALKGRSRPGESRPDQLRGLSATVDRSFSLVHSPDDADGMLHEVDLLLGRATLDAATAPDAAPLSADHAAALFGKAAEPPANICDILFAIVSRAAALSAGDPSSGAATAAKSLFRRSEVARRQLAKGAAGAKLDAAAWRRMAVLSGELSEVFEQERARLDWDAPWTEVRRRLARTHLLRLLIEATDRARFDPRLSRALVDALRAAQVPLGYWEEHQLHVAAAFHGAENE